MTYDFYINGFGIIESFDADSESEAQDTGWELAKEWVSENYYIIKESDEEWGEE